MKYLRPLQCLTLSRGRGNTFEATAKAVTIHFILYSDCTFPTQNCEDQWEMEVHFGFPA